MNVYRVDRVENITWDEDYEMVVIAKDEKEAEKLARKYSESYEMARHLKITRIDTTKAGVVLVANTGA